MTKLFILILFLFSISSFSQKQDISELNGSWIKYKIEMKDGSNLIDRFLTDSSYVNYSFFKKKMSINGNPTHRVNETSFPKVSLKHPELLDTLWRELRMTLLFFVKK